VEKNLNLTNPLVNRDSYLRRIDGIILGEDPKQGFTENSVFYHPTLRFQFNVPTAWRLQNSPQKVQMAPQNGEALMYLTLAAGNHSRYQTRSTTTATTSSPKNAVVLN
jgi:predicted Zn-dependent protease